MCWCFFAVFFLFLSLVFCPFTATPMAYGGSQARGLIGAIAAKLTPQPPDSSYICDLHHSSWRHRILNPVSEVRDRTCNLMVPSQIHFYCAMMGTLVPYFRFYIVVLSCSICLSLSDLLSVRISSCIHVAANGISFFFVAE